MVWGLFSAEKSNMNPKTVLAVHECLESVWNLGNRGMDCQNHPLGEQYKNSDR